MTFEELTKTHYEKINKFIKRKIFDPGKADDLTQETFIRALRTFYKLNNHPNLTAWLYLISKTVMHDHIRRIKSRERWFPMYENHITHQNEIFQSSFFIEKDDEERMERILKAFNSMHPTYRQVLELRLEGLSQSEIAKKLGISMGTVSSRTDRAKKMLLKNLGEDFLD